MSNEKKKKKKDPYKATLNLPKTSFAMRANLIQMEPKFQKRWEKMGLYTRLRELSQGRKSFVLHDGPPYANGSIHLGHLLNKVLKDLVVRSKTMTGHDVDFIPGWDCHGLPIEHKVLQKLGEKARELLPIQIRHRCKSYAERQIKIQSTQMQRLGTIGNYENPYKTMNPAYEAAVLEVFADLVAQGLVYRARKPVHWSIANQTALAEAELVYADREDTSVYVHFYLKEDAKLPESLQAPEGEKISLMIWTTTPWTLPANLAVALSERDLYSLFKIEHSGQTKYVILSDILAESVFEKAHVTSFEKLGECQGRELVEAQLRYEHPFIDRDCPVLAANYVTQTDGTGLVHTAPGHGAEDYQTGIKAGLDIYCPVQGDGTFDDTVPEWLRGKDVWTANGEIVEHLRQSGHLFLDEQFTHSYPLDWRSKTPTIFRATQQWFIGVDRPVGKEDYSLRQKALELTDQEINFIPEWGRNRMRGMLESRPDWCISRQRSWGLPIPAFLHKTEEPLLTEASVRAVAKKIRETGSDFWFQATPKELLEYYDLEADPDAPEWLKKAGVEGFESLEKTKDIFDVWFESGSSWNAVVRQRGLPYPVDLYLEGSDQHRGWFQLSLLPALGATGMAPFKSVLTHGFMVDIDGYKMSKSAGNSILVDELLNKFGADIARWWVSSLNYRNDIKVDWAFFNVAGEEYRKVRNTIRFMLGNLGDYDDTKHRRELTEADRHSIDAWAMQELDKFIQNVREGYENYQFRRVSKGIFDFCNVTMSSIYLAAIKDRLYCDEIDADRRRRTQTVLFDIVNAIIKLSAPILVHTADEAYLSLKGQKPEESDLSIHFEMFPEPLSLEENPHWETIFSLRDDVLKALEEAKESRGINYPLDAGVIATLPQETFDIVKTYEEDLVDLFGVSRLKLQQGDDLNIEIQDLRDAPRCARSWKRDETVKQRSDGSFLSDRDAKVLGID